MKEEEQMAKTFTWGYLVSLFIHKYGWIPAMEITGKLMGKGR